MATQYYFISDMHIGGEGPLDHCDFENELIDFLKMLDNEPGDIELIIVGDAFGLWELTEIEGVEKLRTIVRSHLALFEQFRRTGAKIPITLIPGNHDYDLACDPEYIPLLKEYGITLEPRIAITREILGRRIWIEHGSQHDESNSFPDFGNPHAVPFGWFVMDYVVNRAGEYSDWKRCRTGYSRTTSTGRWRRCFGLHCCHLPCSSPPLRCWWRDLMRRNLA
jgi:UDP-2,3-diacylglucosamine pyrophosphatase LpxH